jgi:hypothetical protein
VTNFDLRKLLARKTKDGPQPAVSTDSRSVALVVSSDGDVPVIERKHLPPDPRIVRAIGRNHSFDSAVADIVDNSLDAGADKILIRFVRDGDELVGLYLADNGRGMGDATIDSAMTLGGQRTYVDGDLGHFGIGLKAASLSQAKSLMVVSRAASGAAVGRRLLADKLSEGFECEVLAGAFAASTLDRSWGHFTPTTGTVIIWNAVKAFEVIRAGAVDAFLDDATGRLCRHLGIIFHRIIAANAVEIVIDQEDLKTSSFGAPFIVKPINPFGYARSGRQDYPRKLTATTSEGSLTLTCHIWPGRTNDPQFKLVGGSAESSQGFFIYRNNRLLQPGGWQGVTLRRPDLQLARVEIEMSVTPDRLFEMNPEKTQVEVTAIFSRLAHAATDGTTTFEGFLEDATNAYRESRRRNRDRPKVLQPGAGLSPKVKSALAEEYEFSPGRDPLQIRWVSVEGDTFFEFDKDASLIKLNKRYRRLVAGEHGSLNDAPLVKALIYLLGESVMRGEMLGSRDKDNISIWQAVLTTAVLAEEKRDRQREAVDISIETDSTTI